MLALERLDHVGVFGVVNLGAAREADSEDPQVRRHGRDQKVDRLTRAVHFVKGILEPGRLGKGLICLWSCAHTHLDDDLVHYVVVSKAKVDGRG